MTDPIADMLTRIRNAVQAKHARVDVPASTLKSEIARILQDEGYIGGFKIVEEPPAPGQTPVKKLRLFLKYGPRGEQVIRRLSDGTILCVYEADIVTGMCDDRYVRLTRFNLAWLTGKDVVPKPVSPK